MASRGDAPPGRVQVSFGRHRILPVTQPIAEVSQQLHQRDAVIRGIALRPARRKRRDAIEHEPAETRVVLREIVDLRFRRRLRRAAAARVAIEVARAFDLERKINLREPSVEFRERAAGLRLDEAQRVT